MSICFRTFHILLELHIPPLGCYGRQRIAQLYQYSGQYCQFIIIQLAGDGVRGGGDGSSQFTSIHFIIPFIITFYFILCRDKQKVSLDLKLSFLNSMIYTAIGISPMM